MDVGWRKSNEYPQHVLFVPNAQSTFPPFSQQPPSCQQIHPPIPQCAAKFLIIALHLAAQKDQITVDPPIQLLQFSDYNPQYCAHLPPPLNDNDAPSPPHTTVMLMLHPAYPLRLASINAEFLHKSMTPAS